MPSDSQCELVEACLSTAFNYVYAGEVESAAPWFRRALTVDPQCGEGWAGLAEMAMTVVLVEAALLYGRAVVCDPTQWRWQIGRGEALLADGAFAAARAVFTAATAGRPSAAEAWRGLALALEGLGDWRDGVDAGRQWLDLSRGDDEAASTLARLLLGAGDPHGAAEVLGPYAAVGRGDDPAVLVPMGRAWLALGEMAKAKAVAERACRVAPDDDAVQALLAVLASPDGGGTPTGAPTQAPTQAYVRALFDRYAERFDRDLVDKLGYVAPSVLAGAVLRVMGAAAGLRVLDLGCGTGLSGIPFRERARMLHGVDLSPAMIAQAEKRGIYDQLTAESLEAALARAPAAWDLLVAADVLAYVGPLSAVFRLSALALAPGGVLAFVVEAMSATETAAFGAAGLVLRESRRYAHDADYLRWELAAAGLDVVLLEPAVLRHDRGQPIEGWCVVARQG